MINQPWLGIMNNLWDMPNHHFWSCLIWLMMIHHWIVRIIYRNLVGGDWLPWILTIFPEMNWECLIIPIDELHHFSEGWPNHQPDVQDRTHSCHAAFWSVRFPTGTEKNDGKPNKKHPNFLGGLYPMLCNVKNQPWRHHQMPAIPTPRRGSSSIWN